MYVHICICIYTHAIFNLFKVFSLSVITYMHTYICMITRSRSYIDWIMQSCNHNIHACTHIQTHALQTLVKAGDKRKATCMCTYVMYVCLYVCGYVCIFPLL